MHAVKRSTAHALYHRLGRLLRTCSSSSDVKVARTNGPLCQQNSDRQEKNGNQKNEEVHSSSTSTSLDNIDC